MTNFDGADYFTDISLVANPYPYFDDLRAKGPVTPVSFPKNPSRKLVAVTGYDEGLAILRDDENFSAINTTSGPFLTLTIDPEQDVDSQIAQYARENPFASTIVSQDLPEHDRSKAILSGIITPARLKANEAFMEKLADQLIDEFADRGTFEAVSEYGQPFAQLVVADLLGVPEEDHTQFRGMLGQLPGSMGEEFDLATSPFGRIAQYFFGYVEDRRARPRKDVLTRLAQQTLGDGTLPEVADVVAVATFLFGAGQDTTVQLFSGMLRYLGDDKALQARLRENRKLIPEFVEEVLRLQGTVKTTFRLAKRQVTVGGVDIAPGTHVVIHIAAMNRDPRQFDNPEQLRIDRENVRTHVAFGRGLHACAGSPLARAEARITLERLFDRTKDLRISELKHGPAGSRRFEFLPNYSLRGVKEVHVEFDLAR